GIGPLCQAGGPQRAACERARDVARIEEVSITRRRTVALHRPERDHEVITRRTLRDARIAMPTPCLEGRASDERGYVGIGKGIYEHRRAYERVKGSIPVGMVIDHLCHNRACVNTDHL